jgi:hypothetical protein
VFSNLLQIFLFSHINCPVAIPPKTRFVIFPLRVFLKLYLGIEGVLINLLCASKKSVGTLRTERGGQGSLAS